MGVSGIEKSKLTTKDTYVNSNLKAILHEIIYSTCYSVIHIQQYIGNIVLLYNIVPHLIITSICQRSS